MVAVVTPVTCFVLDYAYPGRWLTRRNVGLPCIPPSLGLLLVLTDDSQPIWRQRVPPFFIFLQDALALPPAT